LDQGFIAPDFVNDYSSIWIVTVTAWFITKGIRKKAQLLTPHPSSNHAIDRRATA
jgi:hypothetical protein